MVREAQHKVGFGGNCEPLEEELPFQKFYSPYIGLTDEHVRAPIPAAQT